MTIPKDIRELCENPATILKRYRDSGVKVIGYSCSYVPEEMIISADMQPYRVSNRGAETSALTPSFVCPFASSAMENMLKLKDFFSGLVITHTCDPMWRMYDILKKKVAKPIFLLRVPHDIENNLSADFFRAELARFGRFLEENSGAKIDETMLVNSIDLCNENRSLLKDIYMLNKDQKNGISALERFQLVLASMWMPKKEINRTMKMLELDHNATDGLLRVHVNGTAIYDLELIKTIGDSGGFVASDDLCTGSRYFWTNVEDSQEPISALAHRYFSKTPCPSHGPLKRRLEYIDFMVKEFEARGVITFTESFCDPILYDSVHIRNSLAQNGVPSVVIDYENPAQEIGRIKTRVEAFVESLRE